MEQEHGQLAWRLILPRRRGVRYAALHLYRSRHADGSAHAWYATSYAAAFAAARDRSPPQAGAVVRLDVVELDV